MSAEIVIIDYGMGNLMSVKNMLRKLGYKADISSDAATIEQARMLILPGVGAFDKAMNNLKDLGLVEVIDRKVSVDKTPILGICLGMQLMGKGSEEGSVDGFGWFDATCKKFEFEDKKMKVPHMGWNQVEVNPNNDSVIAKSGEAARFYFVHSFYMQSNNESEVLFTAGYGHKFVAGVAKDNIMGVQFHPEKSHRYGFQLLRLFAEHYSSKTTSA